MKNNISMLPNDAAEWALSKVGCAYSQAQRTNENYFDCSSLVARAYSAQGKKWWYGGEVPTSNFEPYDDEFELIWPQSYESIGSCFGDDSVLALATQPGDLQFLCTDKSTQRSNKITHVAIVAFNGKIVHARGRKYGVCTNKLNHYSGKVCALTRYNPNCTLRKGMRGFRTLRLQKALNHVNSNLVVDGVFGSKTESAIRKYQTSKGIPVSGEADFITLNSLINMQ